MVIFRSVRPHNQPSFIQSTPDFIRFRGFPSELQAIRSTGEQDSRRSPFSTSSHFWMTVRIIWVWRKVLPALLVICMSIHLAIHDLHPDVILIFKADVRNMLRRRPPPVLHMYVCIIANITYKKIAHRLLHQMGMTPARVLTRL
jgi:hypothetical protein